MSGTKKKIERGARGKEKGLWRKEEKNVRRQKENWEELRRV